MYQYIAVVDRVVDGDTYDLVIDVGFYIKLTARIRLRGVNTPEVRGEEREAGLAAKVFVEARLPPGQRVLVDTYKVGKFGRYIADVRYLPGIPEATTDELRRGGVDLAAELLRAGIAELMGDDLSLALVGAAGPAVSEEGRAAEPAEPASPEGDGGGAGS